MPFDVRRPKPAVGAFSVLRTATAEELANYEQYQEQKRKNETIKEDIEVLKPGKPRVDPGPSLNLFIPAQKELEAYNEYKTQSNKENFQGERIDLVTSGTTRTDAVAGIFNRDSKKVPNKSAVQNQVSKRNFLK